MMSKVILALSIVWPVWRIIQIRKQVINGDMIIPSFVSSILIFSLFVLIVIIFGVSPFHLIRRMI